MAVPFCILELKRTIWRGTPTADEGCHQLRVLCLLVIIPYNLNIQAVLFVINCDIAQKLQSSLRCEHGIFRGFAKMGRVEREAALLAGEGRHQRRRTGYAPIPHA